MEGIEMIAIIATIATECYRDALRGLEFHRSKARESLDKTNPAAWQTSTSNIENTSRIIEAIRRYSKHKFVPLWFLKHFETI